MSRESFGIGHAVAPIMTAPPKIQDEIVKEIVLEQINSITEVAEEIVTKKKKSKNVTIEEEQI